MTGIGRDGLDRRAVEELKSLPGAAGLVADFIEDGRRVVAELARAAATDDATTIIGLSHRLLGVASTFGASAVGALSAEIERAARSGRLAEASRSIGYLGEEFELVAAELASALA